MTPTPITVTVTINVDDGDLVAALARLADALGSAGPVPSLEHPTHGPTPCTVDGCGFIARTPGGLGPHRRARHPELLGLDPEPAATTAPAAVRITEPAPPAAPTAAPDALELLTTAAHAVADLAAVRDGLDRLADEAAPRPPAPRPPAQYRPDAHRCGCGATFPFRSDLARHRLAEDHHVDDEVDA
jgi:hypothetical protein